MFERKRILVTEGTGSFGNVIVKRLIAMKAKEIIIFSRDEKKQWDMSREYPDLTCVVGDIRDKQRISEAVEGVDIDIPEDTSLNTEKWERIKGEIEGS